MRWSPTRPARRYFPYRSIKADVEGGTSLTNSLRKHPLYFDDLFCNLVEAG